MLPHLASKAAMAGEVVSYVILIDSSKNGSYN